MLLIYIPSCITNPSITCVRTWGLTIALGGACLLLAVRGTDTETFVDSSLDAPLVIELTVLASPAKGLLQVFSSVFEVLFSSSFPWPFEWSASI